MGSTVKGFEGIEEFLQDLRFKKALMGANEADVYACLKDVDAMYRDQVTNLIQSFEEERKQLQQQVKDSSQNASPMVAAELERVKRENMELQQKLAAAPSQQEIDQLKEQLYQADQTIASLKAQVIQSDVPPDTALLRNELSSAKQQVEQLQAQLAQERENTRQAEQRAATQTQRGDYCAAEKEYQKKCELLTNALLETEEKKQSIVEAAEQEASKIVAKAHIEAERLQMEQQVDLRCQKNAAIAELQQMDTMKKNMVQELAQIREKLKNVLQNFNMTQANAETVEKEAEKATDTFDSLNNSALY